LAPIFSIAARPDVGDARKIACGIILIFR